MNEFLQRLVTEWWGITAIIIVALALWVLLSALFYRQFFKRFYDIAISGVVLLIFSPILLIFIIIGWIKMKGNPFFVQFRPGKKKRNGKEKVFKLLKFRTMTNERGADGELLPDAQRTIKYGQWLRATSIDELPSLINIFLGHLSIVGPRPQLVRDMTFMTEEQRTRHNVRPGLTGLAQVNGRNNITWERKFEYDLEYINGGISLFGDIKIILKTVGKVLKKSDVARDGTVSDIDFGDYLLQEGKVSKEGYDKKQAEAKEILRRNA